jgi:hypothetical protein
MQPILLLCSCTGTSQHVSHSHAFKHNVPLLLCTFAGYDYMGTIQKGRDASGRVLDLTLVPYTQQLLQQAQQAGQSYQYAVVLGGINDLGNANQTAGAIFPKLVQVRVAARHECSAVLHAWGCA